MNYNEVMENIIKNLKNKPTLLLHTCCAPCSSAVIQRLSKYFKITVFYYNPNIYPYEEYLKRKKEQIRFLKEYNKEIKFLDCDYENDIYEKEINGLENEKEGGKRCEVCFLLRLRKTAETAKNLNFDYFGTSLTVSPYKNAKKINEIGSLLEKEIGISFLYSDFKKKDGYKTSILLSKEYHLFRQNYCGCIYSKKEEL